MGYRPTSICFAIKWPMCHSAWQALFTNMIVLLSKYDGDGNLMF